MIETEDEARAFVADRCDAAAMARLETFVAELRDENANQNLVAAASLADVWRRHVADSAQLLDLAGPAPSLWLDLGTGAGFPGLVIAAIRPDCEVVLVESRRRRIDWLLRMIRVLSLRRCRVAGSAVERIEALPVRTISARAFAPLPKLVAIAGRFSTSDTRWLLPKGRSAAQEVTELPKRLRAMFHVEQSQTDPEAGIVVGQGTPENTRR